MTELIDNLASLFGVHGTPPADLTSHASDITARFADITFPFRDLTSLLWFCLSA